ncbi:MAG: hypothetical protein EAZ91_23240 [Cytophagales bacterium]|nr:MAG: hypothetical protein EAZ91_23240 [Cytophagales bacterium]
MFIALFMGTTARAGFLTTTPTESRPTSVDACALEVSVTPENEDYDACSNQLVSIVAEAFDGMIPSNTPGAGQARKAMATYSYVWLAPAGASLNTYTGNQVVASFTTSGTKAFTVTATDLNNPGCTATETVEIEVDPAPLITIFFPNSLTVVPISGEQPTVTQITLPNTIRATQGVLYEWHVVIDRINGYEIRQGETNGTGIFQVGHVGPYVLTVTGLNGCKRTVRGTLVLSPSGGG